MAFHTIQEIKELQESASAQMINEYLELMEEFEAPRDYLTWGLISAIAALLGGKNKLSLGRFISVTPCLFVVLVGPAGVRKSSATNAIKRLLERSTVRFGPSDTGGQRHGLMTALEGGTGTTTGTPLCPDTMALLPATFDPNWQRAPNELFLVASELGRLLGTSSREMADFLVDLWDGEDVIYQTRGSETRLYSPVVSLLGATTPSSFATMIPENAAGHGILSRMLFIHADKNYKDVPMAPGLEDDHWNTRFEGFQEKLLLIEEMNSSFALTAGAAEVYKKLYRYTPDLIDPRLGAYIHRRPVMMLKVGMILAAMRREFFINETDIRLAHELLASIEPTMYRALEYFGRNKALYGKMLMLEFLRGLGPDGVVTRAELLSAASRDLNPREAEDALEALLASGEVIPLAGKYALGSVKNETLRLVK